MRYKHEHVENRVEYARSVVNGLAGSYHSGSAINGVSHRAVIDGRTRQYVIRAKTRPELMSKLDAFIEGARARADWSEGK